MTRDGLQVLAEQSGTTFLLHTAHGDVDFLAGVNLGSTTPGHSPGELALSAEDYRRWFDLMGRAGVRVVRIYTIHPPSMYEELRRYNEAHPEAPLYLMQGVYLPDEQYLSSGNLYEPTSTREMDRELKDASDAVHGNMTRHGLRGRANGHWDADVSPWTLAWLVGVEWDPVATVSTDKINANTPAHLGRYFSSTPAASPTERWIATRMDVLAGHEAKRGFSVPIAFVDWPTADPLHHPHEPLQNEDLVGVDANHVVASNAWPAGTFASFHAYPYYPDFLRHEPRYQQATYEGHPDAYAGYLMSLQQHYATMPLMVTEFGVPASLGSAHNGTNGRDQGNHSEAEALAIDADILRMLKGLGLAGGLLFAWTDEWFKFTWNTLPRQEVVDSERRALWHDALTNEQWFGMLAEDPTPVGRRVPYESTGPIREVAINHDAAWVYVDVTLDQEPTAPVTLGFDVVPGGIALQGGGSGVDDYRVVVDPTSDQATAWVRDAIDPVLLDGLSPGTIPPPGPDGWSLQRLTINRELVEPVTKEVLPAEFLDIGNLRIGSWDPADPAYDSRSTVQHQGKLVRLRLPWAMLGLGDPSSRTAVIPVKGRPRGVPVDQIGLQIDLGSGAIPVAPITWEGWQRAQHTERVKAGAQAFADALVDTSE